MKPVWTNDTEDVSKSETQDIKIGGKMGKLIKQKKDSSDEEEDKGRLLSQYVNCFLGLWIKEV